MTLRPPDPNETVARYTTVELVKERLTIPVADVSRDDEILQAIVSGEFAIDEFCGRGFPDIDDPPDSPAVITIVPLSVEVAALSLAIALWKEADSPMGTSGSDSFFGVLSITESTRQMLERSPALVGFRVSWGVG